MSAAIAQIPRMTVEEFLAWDGAGHHGKLELVDGIVRAMAPASAVHSIIQTNIASVIRTHLKGSKCRVGTEAPVIPPLARRANARAPDIAVTCTPVTATGTFEDPVLIVEVLSPNNENATWDSILSLTGLPSLRDILVVRSTSINVELYHRADGAVEWPKAAEIVTSFDGQIHLRSIDLRLPLAEIYDGTPFAP